MPGANGGDAVTLLAGLAIRSSVMLALGLLLSASLAKRSAALRHRVLAAALVGAALIGPFSLALPDWNVTLPVRAIDPGPAAGSAVRVETPTPAAVTAQPSIPDPLPLMLIVWLAGVVVAGGALIAGYVRVSRVAVRASPVEDPRWLDVLRDVARGYGLTRDIAVSRTDSSDLLATWGILRPHVLLPDHARVCGARASRRATMKCSASV